MGDQVNGRRPVFMTGASGFIGGNVLERLVGEGWTVRALARSQAAERRIIALGGNPVAGDIRDAPAQTAGAIAGCDTVLHLAAAMDIFGRYDELFADNVVGTRNIVAAARAAGARRMVLLSSGGVAMTGQDQIGIDETSPSLQPRACPYTSTKSIAETEALAAAVSGFTVIALRPTMVWGPGDSQLVPGLREAARKKDWAWIGGGQYAWSTTHVANVAEACRLALTALAPSGAYYVTDDGSVTFRDFLGALARANGFELGERSVPYGLARFAANAMDGVWRTLKLKGRPALTPSIIHLMAHAFAPSDAKARRILGYAPVITRQAGLVALKTRAGV